MDFNKQNDRMRSFTEFSKVVAVVSMLALGSLCVAVFPQRNLSFAEFRDQAEHRNLKKKGRIVGGQESFPGQYPFMVSLRNGDEGWSWAVCGGSLISPSIVLTAAHCDGSVVFADYNRFDQSNDDGIQRRKLGANDMVVHHQYSHTTLDYDFALIRLSEPFENPQIVKLNTNPDKPTTSQRPRVIGWGRTEYNGNPSQIQKYAELDYIEQNECLRRFGNNYITDQMLCAYAEETDACQGDSGGPLISFDDNLDPIQVGVVSWGAGCASKFPGVYSRVHTIIDWINEKVCGSGGLAPQDCVDGMVAYGAGGSGSSETADDIAGTGGEARETTPAPTPLPATPAPTPVPQTPAPTPLPATPAPTPIPQTPAPTVPPTRSPTRSPTQVPQTPRPTSVPQTPAPTPIPQTPAPTPQVEGGSSGAASSDDQSNSRSRNRGGDDESAGDCQDSDRFQSLRTRKWYTCDYVRESTATRCRTYGSKCPVTCGQCDNSS